jgi:hypothetical protein
MHMSRSFWVLIVAVLSGLLFFCSKLVDNSTDLGAAIIESIDSNKVTINKHIREYVMDTSSAFISDSSFPATSDTGFGVHSATSSYMVIGTKGNERAAGFVQFIPAPDTGTTRIYAANDTLKAITLHFTRDTNSNHPMPSAPCYVTVWYSQVRSHALNPSVANGDSRLGIMRFQDDTAIINVPDSVVDSLDDTTTKAIFKACRDTIKDSTHLAQRPVIGFIVAALNPTDSIVRLNGNMQLTLKYVQGSDTTSHYQTYYITTTTSYLATDGNPRSLQIIPALSYASKRTAVFHYSIAALWDTISHMDNQQHAQVVSAAFSLKGPDTSGDTLNVRYLVCPFSVHNGTALDSLFNVNLSPPGVVTIIGTARVQANVSQYLEWYMKNGRLLPDLYLYLRFAEDSRQMWKKTVWKSKPVLTVMIAVP